MLSEAPEALGAPSPCLGSPGSTLAVPHPHAGFSGAAILLPAELLHHFRVVHQAQSQQGSFREEENETAE